MQSVVFLKKSPIRADAAGPRPTIPTYPGFIVVPVRIIAVSATVTIVIVTVIITAGVILTTIIVVVVSLPVAWAEAAVLTVCTFPGRASSARLAARPGTSKSLAGPIKAP